MDENCGDVETFTEHINTVDNNIKFKWEDVSGDGSFLTAVHTEKYRLPKIEVFRKPPHTGQYLLLDSHHPLELRLGVIRTLNHRAETVSTKTEGKEKKQMHQGTLRICGHP